MSRVGVQYWQVMKKNTIITLKDILLMDEMQSEGLVTSKLRPKLEDCHVAAKNIKALWNKV